MYQRVKQSLEIKMCFESLELTTTYYYTKKYLLMGDIFFHVSSLFNN